MRFKSYTCLCACAFQQQARDPRTAHCVVTRGRGLGSVTREFERDNCVTSEILQSDWTIPNRAGVPTKVPRPSFVRESREGLGTRLPLTDGTPNAREWQSGCDVTFISEPIKKRAKFSRGERLSARPSAGYHAFAAGQHVHAGSFMQAINAHMQTASLSQPHHFLPYMSWIAPARQQWSTFC